MMKFDKIIIGAGIYGLYAAYYSLSKGDSVLVIDCDLGAFRRATYVNQARIHSGYHYPRSLMTAKKSIEYFDRFNSIFGFSFFKEFDQIYAISSTYSWTSAEQFADFCRKAGIKCEEIDTKKYFRNGLCEAAFLTEEYTYDAQILRDYLIDEIEKKKGLIKYGINIKRIERDIDCYTVFTDGFEAKTEYILNATYAAVNQVINLVDGIPHDGFNLKYEKCEIILCDVCNGLKHIGLTVMDGPFFSIMPFGKKGIHSLTSVTFTPHETSYERVPGYDCMQKTNKCSSKHLYNCNECEYRPETAWEYMSALSRKYLKEDAQIKYITSLYSIKPIIKTSEIDDSRPTEIIIHTEKPWFVSVLSGKINTIFDMEEYLFV